MNPIDSQGLRIESMSLEFLSAYHSGNVLRDLAVQQGLLPDTYPQSVRLGTVLGHVEHELERRDLVARWQFAANLQAVANQRFNAADRQALQDWWDTSRLGCASITIKVILTVDDNDDHLARLQRVEDFDERGVRPLLEDLRRARSRMIASLDDWGKNEKKQAVGQWLNEVCASGLPPHEQAGLIGEFAPQVHGLEPREVAEYAWNQCLYGLAGIAARQPYDQTLNERLLQIAETFPVLQKVRYPNNPIVALAQVREQMGQAGYPQVVSALYQTAARQGVASLDQNAKESHLAFGNLLRQIEQSITAGNGVPLPQMRAVLDPAIARWTERNGYSLQTAWGAFLGSCS